MITAPEKQKPISDGMPEMSFVQASPGNPAILAPRALDPRFCARRLSTAFAIFQGRFFY